MHGLLSFCTPKSRWTNLHNKTQAFVAANLRTWACICEAIVGKWPIQSIEKEFIEWPWIGKQNNREIRILFISEKTCSGQTKTKDATNGRNDSCFINEIEEIFFEKHGTRKHLAEEVLHKKPESDNVCVSSSTLFQSFSVNKPYVRNSPCYNLLMSSFNFFDKRVHHVTWFMFMIIANWHVPLDIHKSIKNPWSRQRYANEFRIKIAFISYDS